MISRFVDLVATMCILSAPMRRGICIRAAFAPTRLAAEHLRDVYERLVPIAERVVVDRVVEDSVETQAGKAAQQREADA